MSEHNLPEIDYVRQCLECRDGKLYWLERPSEHFNSPHGWNTWNAKWAGREAGFPHKESRGKGSRWSVRLHGHDYKRSWLVWVLCKGEWPTALIDHENRNCLDDRIGNLRLATLSQNRANSRKPRNSTSGFKGVTWDAAEGKWMAQITAHGRKSFLGYFADPLEAHAAYVDAAKRHFGDFYCAG